MGLKILFEEAPLSHSKRYSTQKAVRGHGHTCDPRARLNRGIVIWRIGTKDSWSDAIPMRVQPWPALTKRMIGLNHEEETRNIHSIVWSSRISRVLSGSCIVNHDLGLARGVQKLWQGRLRAVGSRRRRWNVHKRSLERLNSMRTDRFIVTDAAMVGDVHAGNGLGAGNPVCPSR